PVAILSVLLVLFLAGMVASFLYAQAQGRQQNRYNELISDQRRLAREISDAATSAATGKIAAYDRLHQVAASFQFTVQSLQYGDPATGLPPLPPRYDAQLEALHGAWEVARVNIQAIIGGRASILRVTAYLDEIEALSDSLLQQTGEVVDQLVARDAPAAWIQL